MNFKKESNTIEACAVCGNDFKPNELGHYECKTTVIKENANDTK